MGFLSLITTLSSVLRSYPSPEGRRTFLLLRDRLVDKVKWLITTRGDARGVRIPLPLPVSRCAPQNKVFSPMPRGFASMSLSYLQTDRGWQRLRAVADFSMGLRIKAVHEPLKLWEMERYHQPQPGPEKIYGDRDAALSCRSSDCPSGRKRAVRRKQRRVAQR